MRTYAGINGGANATIKAKLANLKHKNVHHKSGNVSLNEKAKFQVKTLIAFQQPQSSLTDRISNTFDPMLVMATAKMMTNG